MEDFVEPEILTADSDGSDHNLQLDCYILPIGLMPGFVVRAETIAKAREAAERAEEEDKNKRPPKPPSRPNARIGNIALGNT